MTNTPQIDETAGKGETLPPVVLAREDGSQPLPAPIKASPLVNWLGHAPAPPALARVIPRSKFLASFILLVVLPTLAMALYSLVFSSSRYVAEFRVAVRAVEAMKSAGLPAILGLSGASQAGNDSHAVVQYLQSREIIEELEKTLPLRKIYGADSADFFSRLASDAKIEEFVTYWRKMVDAYYETTTGTVIVRVSAFKPDDAHQVAIRSLGLAEELVNRLSMRGRQDLVRFAEGQVEEATARLLDIRKRMQELRDREQILDPRKAAEATLSLAARMKDEIAKLNQSLAIQLRYMTQTSPAVMVTKERLSALQRELERVQSEATTLPSGSPKPLSAVVGDFEQIENERLFAEKSYQAAMATLETTRMDANRQHIYLATIVRPGLPEEPSYPKPAKDIALAFAIAMAVWLVLVFGFLAIREHAT